MCVSEWTCCGPGVFWVVLVSAATAVVVIVRQELPLGVGDLTVTEHILEQNGNSVTTVV